MSTAPGEVERTGARPRILVFGAGVLGSLYAARLADAGHDVTLYARGRRYRDLVEHGVVLEDFASGTRTVSRLPIVEAVDGREAFDVCIVLVRKTQLAGALGVLAGLGGVRAFLFMVNTAEGPEAMIDAVGLERVLLGFANAGGERDGHVVRFMVAEGKGVTLGELDGSESHRLRAVAAAFRDAGFGVSLSRRIDAWLRHHVALVGPLANALYAVGADAPALAADGATLRLGLRAVREALGVVRAAGFPYEPRALGALRWLPDVVLLGPLRRALRSPLLDIGGVRHAVAARDEMDALNEELFALARGVGRPTPAMAALRERARAWAAGTAPARPA